MSRNQPDKNNRLETPKAETGETKAKDKTDHKAESEPERTKPESSIPPAPAKNKTFTRRNMLTVLGGTGLIAATGLAGWAWKTFVAKQSPVAVNENEWGDPNYESGLALPPTTCEKQVPTASDNEGPFYRPDSPHKPDLTEAESNSEQMLVSGRLLDTSCRPIAGGIVDVWHVDDEAEYDNESMRYRGHVYSDKNGLWQFRSILPQPYNSGGASRTAHIHIKAQGPDTKLLTTQLYFPSQAANNEKDGGYKPELLLAEQPKVDATHLFTFDLVLETS